MLDLSKAFDSDLSKAFDSVHHQILMNKCLKLNIDPFWLEDYLSNRVHSVV